MSRFRLSLPVLAFLAVPLLALPAALADVRWDPSHPETGVRSRAYPINASMFNIVQPDGFERKFRRDPADHSVIQSDYPWAGRVDGRDLVVATDPGFKGGRLGFLFRRGRLVRVLRGQEEFAVAHDAGTAVTNSLASLWKESDPFGKREDPNRYDIWRGGHRLRLWFTNPNKAGTFLAGIALVGLALLFSSQWPWSIHGLLVAAIGILSLVFTQSRSALIGFVLGAAMIVFVQLRKRLRSLWRLVPVLLVLSAVGVGGVCMTGAGERLTCGLVKEDNETSRLPIWKAVPRMMADAPAGWGLGNSGVAYLNWYQPQERLHIVRALLNTHLTWMTEFGWIGGSVYVFAWVWILSALSRRMFRDQRALAFACWLMLGVAASFNHVGEDAAVWIVPMAAACWRIAELIGRRQLGSAPFVWGGAAAAFFLAAVLGIRLCTEADVGIAGSPTQVAINGRNPDCWIVDDRFVLDGGYCGEMGKCLRAFYSRNPSAPPLGHVYDLENLPGKMRRLTLAGWSGLDFVSRWQKDPKSLPAVRELVFLSPPFAATELPVGIRRQYRIRIVHGEFAIERADVLTGEMPPGVEVASGANLYVSNWIETCLGI